MTPTVLTKVTYRGDTAKCLELFRRDYGSSTGRELLVQFMGVNEATVRRWLSGGKPHGENLIRIRYLLEAFGYESRELNHLSEAARNLGRAVAFRVVSIDEVVQALDFQSEEPQQSVFRVLLGKVDTTSLRTSVMEDLVDSKREEVERQIVAFKMTMSACSSSPILNRSSVPGRPPKVGSPVVKSDAVEMLAHLVCAMLPLAEDIVSDRFSPKDRERLRELAGGDGVFNLSTNLNRLRVAMNRLCGERARRICDLAASAAEGGGE